MRRVLGDGAEFKFRFRTSFFMKKALREWILPCQMLGDYGLGMLYFPKDDALRDECKRIIYNFRGKTQL